MAFFTSDWLLTFDMNVYKLAEKLWLSNPAAAHIMDLFWTFITHLGDDGIFWIALSLVLCIFKKTRKIGFAAIIALGCTAVVNNLFLKDFFDRARPYVMDPSNWERVATDGWMYKMPFEHLREDSVSFPSGHTASSFAAAMGIFYIDKKKGIIPLILAALISFSRIYIHVHYPSDVFVGMLIGIVFALITCGIVFGLFGGVIDRINEKMNYKLFPTEEEKPSKSKAK